MLGASMRCAQVMIRHYTTLTRYLIEQRRRYPESDGTFNSLVLDIALAAKSISRVVAQGTMADHGDAGSAGGLSRVAHELVLGATEWGGQLAAVVSEELDPPYIIPEEYPRGDYLLCVNPINSIDSADGSHAHAATFAVTGTVGSIFSVLRRPPSDDPAVLEDFYQPGSQQVAAGYAIYGPATMLVLTVGRGTHGFTLDPGLGEFFLTHPNMTVHEGGGDFAINGANRRHWEPAVRRYVDECLQGSSGPRERDFTMRWVASLVAETHRILTVGGVFLYPVDATNIGPVRLLTEAAPIAFLIEQAGGLARTRLGPVCDVVPHELHQGIGLFFGARAEVERIARYHDEPYEDPAGTDLDLPLYARRGLFRSPY